MGIMENPMTTMLNEIATALGNGAQGKIAEYVQVGQPTVSKWLKKGATPSSEYAPRIYSLYHEVTGKKIDLPVVTHDNDDITRRVIENMRKMSEESRKELLQISELFASRPR